MNTIRKLFSISALVIFVTSILNAQSEVTVPEIMSISDEEILTLFNREASVKTENDQSYVYLDAKPGDGFIKLQNYEFSSGTIEVDLKGTDIQGRSFIGVLFNGMNDSTYDVVYFRPFNFKSEDSVRAAHSVQYISHPEFTWFKLRNEHPGKYENNVTPVPDPLKFFHVKIVITKPTVKVYVENSTTPSLVIKELSNRPGGWIGLWTGNNSDGSFANLQIIKNVE